MQQVNKKMTHGARGILFGTDHGATKPVVNMATCDFIAPAPPIATWWLLGFTSPIPL